MAARVHLPRVRGHAAQSQLPRILGALPDAVTAAWFMTLWIAPMSFGEGGVRQGVLVMLLEFVLIHAFGMLPVLLALALGKRLGLYGLASALALLYLGFVAAFAVAFREWWPVLVFGWIMLGKVTAAVDEHAVATWGMSVVYYILGALFTAIVPLPALGLATVTGAELGLPGSGLWISQPQSALAFGVLYFALLAATKWHLLRPQPPLPPNMAEATGGMSLRRG